MRSPIVGRVKSGCLSPTFGAYGAAEAREVEPNNIPQAAKVSTSFRIVRLLIIRGARGYLTAFAAVISASVVCRSRNPSRKSFARITPC